MKQPEGSIKKNRERKSSRASKLSKSIIMTEITIDPAKRTLSMEVKSESLHALGFEIIVFNTDGNSYIEGYEGSTASDSIWSAVFKREAEFYIGKYICGTFVFKSPNGNDGIPFTARFGILQGGWPLEPDIAMTGTTSNGKQTILESFHLSKLQ